MRGIGPRISDRHYDMLKVLEGYFESQRGALERVIEDGYRYYITEMRANGSQGHQATADGNGKEEGNG
jgi:hypothetical protein